MHGSAGSFLLLVVSGISHAFFALPVKFFRSWRWEHMWAAQGLAANILLPLLWSALLPWQFWTVLGSWSAWQWAGLLAYGVAWGIGGVAYGLVLTRLGATFAYSFVFGIATLTGAVLPIALHETRLPAHVEKFSAGLGICLLATIMCAGGNRPSMEKSATPGMAIPLALRSYPAALLAGVVSGLFSAGYGLAFSNNFDAIEAARQAGLSPVSAPMIVNLPVCLGSSAVAIPVGLTLAWRSRSVACFWGARPVRNWMLAMLMAMFGIGGLLLYSIVSDSDGHLAPNVSFGIFMASFVLGGNLAGVLTGELTARSRASRWLLALGIAGLIWSALLLRSS